MTRTALTQEGLDEHDGPEGAFVDLEAPDFDSFWRARVWKFRHTNPASQVMSINWRFPLPSGGFSTDPAFFILLEGFKTVVWGMLSNDAYGKRLSVGTLSSMGGGIREAFRWFVWQGIEDFSQIPPALQEQYLNVLPKLILAKEEVYPGFVAEGRFGRSASSEVEADDTEEEVPTEDDAMLEDDGVSYSQVANRLGIIYYIHAQRNLLQKRGLPVFSQAPFNGKTFGEQSRSLAEWVINRIPALPPAVSVPLLHEVVRWIDEVGAKVAHAHEAYQSGRRRAMDAAFAELDEAGFSEKRLALIPWRERLEEGGNELGDPVGSEPHRMRLAALMFRDACVLALQYFAGLRISEVCSPKVYKRKKNGLASCLYKRVSPDGMMDLYFLKGMLVKGRTRPKANDWVIGCVPRGSNQVPVLVRALDQLHDLFSPFYSDDKEMPLFLHFGNGWGMPQKESSLVQADGVALQRGCRRFVRCFVDLSKLPNFDEFGNSLVRYREYKGQCIRTHQGRKTFADYCLKTRKSALSPLSFHYGHLTEAITYKGYYEPIQRLGDDLETMAHSATVDYFVSRAEGKAVFGNMAEAVERFFVQFKLKSIKDLQVLRAKIKEIVVAHDIRIYFSDHGNCFISALPTKSRCQEAAGGASWMLRRPSYLTRTVSMCAGCHCFVFDETHRPHWENRAVTWKQAAQDPTNRVAVKCFQQSQIVLRHFRKS